MQIVILGRIAIRERDVEIKWAEQWGGTYLSRGIKGEILSLGDDLKIATTDAMKKCATQLGVALYLYDSDTNAVEVGSVFNAPKQEEVQNIRTQLEGKREATATPEKEETKMITPAQKNALNSILNASKIEIDTLLGVLSVDKIDDITYDVAASIITKKHDFWNK